MTSPSLNKNGEKPKNGDKKSPAKGDPRTPTKGPAAQQPTEAEPRTSEMFGWLRVFKMADLMLRQGC